MQGTIERRRTIRLKRSALLRSGLEQVEKPSIKIAETVEEYTEAFRILYEAYLDRRYIPENQLQVYCTPFHLLHSCQVFVFKAYLTVIATVTKVEDSEVFGLPMDCLYKDELDRLRDKGRKVVEFCSFASPKDLRFTSAMLFLKRSMYFQCLCQGVNDICIMVNPKHVAYYKEILLFEDFGGVRTYEKFDAPAVGLRLSLDNYRMDLQDAYGAQGFDTNLHDFFYARDHELAQLDQETLNRTCCGRSLGRQFAIRLLEGLPGLTAGLDAARLEHLRRMYPGVAALDAAPASGQEVPA